LTGQFARDPLPIVVLVSGRGSNLQALLDAEASGALGGTIRAVISNRPCARALERARRAGVVAEIIDHENLPDRESFDRELIARIEIYRPGLIALAGYMRLLTSEFVHRYYGRMLNIHPSVLPEFRGLHTHERALAAGAKHHGCSVHFVSKEVDAGPVILQARVPVLPDDDTDSLAARVLQREHVLFPLAVRWFCEGRLRLIDDRVHLDGVPLTQPIMLGDDGL
jgi:phosphoribosylglycinamide formyltransferase 1